MATVTPMVISAMVSAAATMKSAQDQKKAASIVNQQQNLKIQQQQVKDAAEERRRKELLKQQSATQRARFAGLGIGSGGGSSDAVLEGLRKRSEAVAQDRATLKGLAKAEQGLSNNANLLSQKNAAFKGNIDLLIGKK